MSAVPPMKGDKLIMKEATERSIFRWIHIVFAIPIIGYIYSPFEQIPNYAPLPGLSSFLYLSSRDFGCGKAMSFEDLFRRDRRDKVSRWPTRLRFDPESPSDKIQPVMAET